MAETNEYVKLWLSYDSYFEAYDAASVGRLVLAMLSYRRTGEAPAFDGPERFIWPAIQRDIDEGLRAQAEISQARSKAGQMGAQAKQANADFACREEANQANQSKSSNGQGKGQGKGQGNGQGDLTRAKRFTPPTLAEVQSYVAERHSPVDPQEFIDFYAAKGWMVGKTPMKDWKAACRNAEKWDRWGRREPPTRKSWAELAAEMDAEEGAL